MQFTRCKLTTALCSAFPAGTPELWKAASAQLPLHMHSCAMRRASPSSQGRCHDVRKHSLEQQPPRKPLLTQEDYFLVTQQALHQMKGAKCLCDSTNLPRLHRTSANHPASNIRNTRARRQWKSYRSHALVLAQVAMRNPCAARANTNLFLREQSCSPHPHPSQPCCVDSVSKNTPRMVFGRPPCGAAGMTRRPSPALLCIQRKHAV